MPSVAIYYVLVYFVFMHLNENKAIRAADALSLSDSRWRHDTRNETNHRKKPCITRI